MPSPHDAPARDVPPALHYLGVLRRQAWVIAAVLAAVLAVTVAITLTSPTRYRSSMNIVVRGVEPGTSPQPATQTVSSLLQSDVLARRVIQRLELNMTSERLLADLRLATRPESAVLTASYDHESPRTALAVLRELGRIFPDFVEQTLGEQEAAAGSSLRVAVFDPARVLPGPVAPRRTWNAAVGLVVGLLLGLALAFVRDLVAARPRTRSTHGARPPVVASVPHPADARSLNGARGGRYGELVKVVSELLDERGSRVLLVPGGPQTAGRDVWLGLALGLAAAGRSTLAVAGDPARADAVLRLGVPRSPGLAELLSSMADGASVTSVVAQMGSTITTAQLGVRMLDVLPAGGEGAAHAPPPAPHALGALITVLEQMAYEAVIVQCAELDDDSARAWAAAAGNALVIGPAHLAVPPGTATGIVGLIVLEDGESAAPAPADAGRRPGRRTRAHA